jgi:hypothetical protein
MKDIEIIDVKKAVNSAFEQVVDQALESAINSYNHELESKQIVGKSLGFSFNPKFKIEQGKKGTACVCKVSVKETKEFTSDPVFIKEELELVDDENNAKDFSE